jgi:hypothetical protein
MLSGLRRDVCARCEAMIIDPTVQVIHGAATYCCVNCSQAAEATGSGSDRKALRRGDDVFWCSHCGVAIVHEDTMESYGTDAFCCSNCAAMADRLALQGAGRGGQSGRSR